MRTAGTYKPNNIDISHYHFLIDDKGNLTNGNYTPEDNLNCNDGKYAAHTGGGNTGSIGVAMCGMFGFKDKNNIGYYPLTAIQFEACMKFCAQLCKKYGLKITPQTVMTHYEFGQAHPKTTSYGKIDISYIPSYPHIVAGDVGKFIRSKIRWYYDKENAGS